MRIYFILLFLVPSLTYAQEVKTVRNVFVTVGEIFEDTQDAFYQTVNKLKINTRKEVVLREVKLKPGDEYSEFAVRESERALRNLRYLRYVKITPKFDGDQVDLYVRVEDAWSIIPLISYTSGGGKQKQSIGLSESNLVGFGKRIEGLYEEEDGRETVEAVVEDPRIWGTDMSLLAAYFDRNDGERVLFSFSSPFRTLLDQHAWSFTTDTSDTIGRLYKNGDERYIFRQNLANFNLRYTFSRGNPDTNRRRFSIGYDYEDSDFSQATEDDYDDIDLDPDSVSKDPALLADDRRYSGPVFTYQSIIPDYISMNYIDRFERVEDYNLGDEYSLNLMLAPEDLGSRGNSALFSANRSRGMRIGGRSFLRGEVGLATRTDTADDQLENTLARAEIKYFNVLGPRFLGKQFLGKHTLAASVTFEFTDKLDKDRELLLGSDNGLRGYDARTFTGDQRFVLNLEDRIHIADDLFQLFSFGAAGFIDAGGVSEHVSGIFENDFYSDIGVGMRFAFPRFSGSRVLRVDVAFPMRADPDGKGRFEPRFIFSGGQVFGARLRSESLGPEKASVDIGFDR